MPEIDRAVDEMGWMLPTDIQAESIGLILGGGDVLMAAETGSGKTGAFSIPVIQIVHEAKNQKEKGDKGGKGGPAGDVGPEGVRLNAFDRDADLAIQGNAAQARHFKSWYGARATHGVTGSGKWFFEMKCNDEGLSRVGFSTLDANYNLGTCRNGYGYGGTAKKSNNRNSDMKENYVHRIGRVGRAERMGLAISFAAIDEKEKVWYHSNCNNRGRGCYNTNLTDHGGCCIWYNEKQLLTDIEEHLGVTIDAVQPSMKVPQNEFDGKVVYGEKLGKQKVSRGHIDEITPQLDELKTMEKLIQGSFLDLGYRRKAKLQAWLPTNQGT